MTEKHNKRIDATKEKEKKKTSKTFMVGSRRVILAVLAGGVLSGCTGKIEGLGMVPPSHEPPKNSPSISEVIHMTGSELRKEVDEIAKQNPDASQKIPGASVEARTKQLDHNRVLVNIKEIVTRDFKGNKTHIAIRHGDFMMVDSVSLKDFFANKNLTSKTIQTNFIVDGIKDLDIVVSGSPVFDQFILDQVSAGHATIVHTEIGILQGATARGLQIKQTADFLSGMGRSGIMGDQSTVHFYPNKLNSALVAEMKSSDIPELQP